MITCLNVLRVIMKIEKNVVFAGAAGRSPSGTWDYLDGMEVGDSIHDKDASRVDTTESKVLGTLRQKARKNGWKVRGQKDPSGGIRIWRIK